MSDVAFIVEIASVYWFFIFLLLNVVALLIAVSSADDFFIDVCFWARRIYRAIFIRPKYPALPIEKLYEPAQQPIAILVPAWHEAGVIDQMLEGAVETLDYDRFVLFVGTYCNDPETQADVDRIAARFPAKVRKVVVPNPGPTSKADCLNTALQDIRAYEADQGVEFAGFVLHDAEDILHRLELRLFNFLLPRKDFIQLPVFPLERDWSSFTGSHYIDEFAEFHAKDLVVRESLIGQVPSAGVGTCFSRRAMAALESEDIVFNPRSLTEDYEISFRLKRLLDVREIFVRFPVAARLRRRGLFGREREREWREHVGVREFFPNRLEDAVRQKSRWITGIVFQGLRNLRWRGSLAQKYFLLRDRKGAVTNLLNVLGYFIVLNVLGMFLYRLAFPDGYAFPALVRRGDFTWYLLVVNAFFFANRLAHRVYFVWDAYGPFEAVLSMPRLVWGNLINFLAAVRAFRNVLAAAREGRQVPWDKTRHDMPDRPSPTPASPGDGAAFRDLLATRAGLDPEKLRRGFADYAARGAGPVVAFLVAVGAASEADLTEIEAAAAARGFTFLEAMAAAGVAPEDIARRVIEKSSV